MFRITFHQHYQAVFAAVSIIGLIYIVFGILGHSAYRSNCSLELSYQFTCPQKPKVANKLFDIRNDSMFYIYNDNIHR